MSISDIRAIQSACSQKFYYASRKAEETKRNHHIVNLTPGFSFHPFVIDQTGYIGPHATEFIKYFNKLSGIKAVDKAGKQLNNSKEMFLRRRILFFCNLKCAIARENALLQLKPFKIAVDSREFE